MKGLIFIFVLIASTICSAQTKVIAHKSHSGNKSTFSKAYQKSLFDSKNSNFGVSPEVDVTNAQLDSLIFVNDTTQIMVTTEFCSNRFGKDARTEGEVWNSKNKRWVTVKAQEVSEDRKTSKWKAGRDTVYNHRLFSKKNDLRYIKVLLDSKYSFTKPAKDVVFVGYSDKPEMDKAENSNIKTTLLEEDYSVEIEMTGLFEINGYFGLEKKDDQANWKVIIPLKDVTDSKTPNINFFKNNSEKFPLSYFARQIEPRNQDELEKGVYRLFARTYGRNDMVYSNEFEIE